jgi:hypothetical protein
MERARPRFQGCRCCSQPGPVVPSSRIRPRGLGRVLGSGLDRGFEPSSRPRNTTRRCVLDRLHLSKGGTPHHVDALTRPHLEMPPCHRSDTGRRLLSSRTSPTLHGWVPPSTCTTGRQPDWQSAWLRGAICYARGSGHRYANSRRCLPESSFVARLGVGGAPASPPLAAFAIPAGATVGIRHSA